MVNVDFEGPSASQFGRLDTQTSADLSGTLNLTLSSGYEPLQGAVFSIIQLGREDRSRRQSASYKLRMTTFVR